MKFICSQGLEELSDKYPGKILLEISRRGDGENLDYVLLDSATSQDYVSLLWKRDSQLNEEDQEFIGSTQTYQL